MANRSGTSSGRGGSGAAGTRDPSSGRANSASDGRLPRAISSGAETIASTIMDIRIDGASVWYAFFEHPRRWYEIRSVSSSHIAGLRVTPGHLRYSSSATVQWLTHRYKQFREDGRPVAPCRIPLRNLADKTPYGLA